tara:strand:- start:236 stop:472 length:237 start_codon:yes stop_codon:yes gene_type:complete
MAGKSKRLIIKSASGASDKNFTITGPDGIDFIGDTEWPGPQPNGLPPNLLIKKVLKNTILQVCSTEDPGSLKISSQWC